MQHLKVLLNSRPRRLEVSPVRFVSERQFISVDDVRQKYRDLHYVLQTGASLLKDSLDISHNLMLRGKVSGDQKD